MVSEIITPNKYWCSHLATPAVPGSPTDCGGEDAPNKTQVWFSWVWLSKLSHFLRKFNPAKSLESRKRRYKSVSTAAQSRNFDYSHGNLFIS